jgi:phosphotransferase system  glucose/maltose/N-acetylglucosamine-specific IIC component
MVIPITASFVSLFCAIFPLFMKSKNSQTGKSYGVFETIKNVLKFKLNIIMILISLYIILSASSNFGGYAAFVAIVACIILYFFSSVYHQYTPKATDHSSFGLGDFVQAEKPCIPKAVAEGEPSMFEKIGKLFGGAKRAKK